MTLRPARGPSAASVATAALAVVLLVTGCASSNAGDDAPARITGRLRADRIPPDATAEVYRDEGDGPAVPVAGTTVRLDNLGKFTTGSLRAGRYLIVVRTREAPPSVANAVVPSRTEVELRLGATGGGTTVTLVGRPEATQTLTLRLSPANPQGPVPDRREVVLLPGRETRVAGMKPGLWHVDVLPDGVTADFEVPAGEGVPKFIIEPPPFPAIGVAVEGTVMRRNGEPAFGAAVTIRPALAEWSGVKPWGRVALVDRDGRFRVDRLPEGPVYISIESRDASFRLMPPPEMIRISPPGATGRAYVVEP